MNQFLNYKRWKMANWPRNIPEPDQVNGEFASSFYADPEHFRTKHGNYIITVRPDRVSNYHGDPNTVTIEGSPSQLAHSSNQPDVGLSVAQGMVTPTFKLLHHLFNSHNVVLPGGHNTSTIEHSDYEPDLNKPSSVGTRTYDPADFEDEATDETAKKGQSVYPESRSYGKINTNDDLTNHLSELFGNLFLHHLNHRTGTIRHPGMDYATDAAEYKPGEQTPDLMARKAIQQDHFMSGEHRANDALTKLHKSILKEYLTHHLQYPDSNMSYASFLASYKKHPEVATSLIRDILGGKFRRG